MTPFQRAFARAGYTPPMSSCCRPGDYKRFFSQRLAHRLAKRYRKRGLDKTARKMTEFLKDRGVEGATLLEIGGGIGEIEIELLKAGAARAQNLELSPGYEEEANRLAEDARVRARLDWRLHDIAEDPRGVEPADLVVLQRVVCCYPHYERLLGAAADHARRALVLSYPRRNALLRTFFGVLNLALLLRRRSFRVFAPPATGDARRAGGAWSAADIRPPRRNLAGRWPRAGLVGLRRGRADGRCLDVARAAAGNGVTFCHSCPSRPPPSRLGPVPGVNRGTGSRVGSRQGT
jgi:hypothetical protein